MIEKTPETAAAAWAPVLAKQAEHLKASAAELLDKRTGRVLDKAHDITRLLPPAGRIAFWKELARKAEYEAILEEEEAAAAAKA